LLILYLKISTCTDSAFVCIPILGGQFNLNFVT
jgi:hypothetical protein